MNTEVLKSYGIHVIDNPLHLDAYRRDLWPRDTLSMYKEGRVPPSPALVVAPRNPTQVAQSIRWAESEGLSVVPYGAGSGVCGGARGRKNSLVIDMKRMNRVLRIDTKNQTVHVQSGILGQHLEDLLERIGWMTAHSPSSIACSTAGGYLAARSAGQFSSRYGVFDDLLLAANAETPTGTLQTGVWTPAGKEDLLPILCGSEGGIGIVTDMLLRITPQPQTRWFRGYAFNSIEDAWSAMRELMQSGLWPSVLRLYDPVDTNIGGKTKASDNKASSGGFGWLRSLVSNHPNLRHHLLNIPLSVPSLLNKIGAVLSNEVLLIVGFEGPSAVVHASSESAQSMLQSGRDLGPSPGHHWFAHRHDVSYKLAPVFIAGAFADTMEVATTWAKLPQLYQAVQSVLAKNVAVMAHFSHAYPEGCSIYFSFAGKGTLEVYDQTWRAALAAAREAGGTVTHHHGVGTLKAEEAAKEAGAAVQFWYELKQQFDPKGIMNPGRPFPVNPPTFQPNDELKEPQGGPVFEIDDVSLLAKIDPHACVDEIESALRVHGVQLQMKPDRTVNDWLNTLQRSALDAWECPLVAVQLKNKDGQRYTLSPAPRSAAGPDLRWSAMRRDHVEWVQVPIRKHGDDIVVEAGHPNLGRNDLRPVWYSTTRWGFKEQQATLAELCFGKQGDDTEPPRSPVGMS